MNKHLKSIEKEKKNALPEATAKVAAAKNLILITDNFSRETKSRYKYSEQLVVARN
jgi:hypothetical protein